MSIALIARLAWRDLRSGEIGLLFVALVVAVATVTSISLFVDRLQNALLQESSNFLAADRQISSGLAIPQPFIDKAVDANLNPVQTMVFPSMVFAGERNQLVSVKAVERGYPLRGKLLIAGEPFADGAPTQDVPAPGTVWLDSRLFPAMGLSLGDTVEVGFAQLQVTRVLISEPDRGGSFFDLGPRLLMNLVDVPATEVVQPGSRISYRLLLAGDENKLEGLRESLPLEPDYRWVSIRESSPRIGSALERAESFLLLGGLLGVLLAGLAVALSAHRYAQRHFDHVGVLKTLGATPKQIVRGFLSLLLLVGAASILLGITVGGVVHLLIVEILVQVIEVSLPAPSMRPFLLGATTGLVCALAFAMPAFLHLQHVAPMRVIRRDLGEAPMSRWVSYAAALAGSVALLIWYTKSTLLTLWTLAGVVGVSIVFGGMAWSLLKGGRAVGMQARSGWRLALAGLQRRRQENTVQILVFGIAIMLLLVLLLIRTALISEWRGQVPDNAANHFVMNVAADEVDGLNELIAEHATRGEGLFPMIRGRVAMVNDKPAKEWQAALPVRESRSSLSSERNLTWSATAPGNNKIIAGAWWSEDSNEAQVSLEAEYAENYSLSLGDLMTFSVGGQEVMARVTSLRSVEWESMSPNFFIIFSPAALQEFAATYMTSFYLPSEKKIFLNQLLSSYPTVTVIEIDALIDQVQSIVNQVSQAVELVLVLVMFSGALVLLASIEASRDTRMSEHALIRALGGTRRLIGGSLTAEFLALGVFAGIVAAVGAELTVGLLQSQVFELDVALHPWVWISGPVLGGAIITAIGLLGSRRLVDSPPMNVLRGLN